MISLKAYTVDCKTVGFFHKISKEIGKAWQCKREAREPHTPVENTDCFAV